MPVQRPPVREFLPIYGKKVLLCGGVCLFHHAGGVSSVPVQKPPDGEGDHEGEGGPSEYGGGELQILRLRHIKECKGTQQADKACHINPTSRKSLA